MALKSSQPRRSASLKSERPILRTTNAVETPNNCSLGLAKYCVAMARSPCSWSQGKRRAFKSRAISLMRENRDRARQTKFNEKELCRTTPVATGAVSLARLKQDSTHGWVNCASAHIVCCVASPNDWCRPMLVGLRIAHARPGRAPIELLTAGSTGTIFELSERPQLPTR